MEKFRNLEHNKIISTSLGGQFEDLKIHSFSFDANMVRSEMGSISKLIILSNDISSIFSFISLMMIF